MYQTNYIVIPKDYWTTTTNGEVMLEYEEVAQLKIQIKRHNALIEYLEKIRLISMQALEAINESGVVAIAEQAISELEELKSNPSGQ